MFSVDVRLARAGVGVVGFTHYQEFPRPISNPYESAYYRRTRAFDYSTVSSQEQVHIGYRDVPIYRTSQVKRVFRILFDNVISTAWKAKFQTGKCFGMVVPCNKNCSSYCLHI